MTLYLNDDGGNLARYADIEGLLDAVDATLSGTFDVDLPIAVLTDGSTYDLGSFSIAIVPEANADDALDALLYYLEDTEDSARALALLPFVDVDIPDIVSVLGNFSLLSLINDPTVVIDGIDLALGALQDVFEGLVADDLPLIGSKAAGAASFLRDIRLNLLTELRRDLANRPPSPSCSRLCLIFGPAWLGVLQDTDGNGFVDLEDVTAYWVTAAGVPLLPWRAGGGAEEADAIEFFMELGGRVELGVWKFPWLR